MRLKDDSVNIRNLNTVFKKRLALLDMLHKEMTGIELIITSGNDGSHSKNSKHYTDDAVDFRRWYIDFLDEQKKEQFIKQMNEIFEDELFDIVLEKDHYHAEYDPKIIKEKPKPRIKKPKKFEIPVKEKEPISKEPIKPKINISTLEQLDYDSAIKGIINYVFDRVTGFHLFKDKIKDKSKSILDYLRELIQTIIQKLKGKEK